MVSVLGSWRKSLQAATPLGWNC